MARNVYLPNDDQLKTQAKLAATNYFVEINNMLSDVYKSPKDREKAKELASVKQYEKMGGEDFKGLRISLRDFEPIDAPTKKLKFVDFDVLERLDFNLPLKDNRPKDNLIGTPDSSLETLCVSLGAILCLSFGGEVFAFKDYKYDPEIKYDVDRYNEALNILRDLKKFSEQENFQTLLNELYSKPVEKMHDFVYENIINKKAIEKRDIDVPSDILIQRSAFSDNRPTLFCVTKYAKNGTTKFTITYDADM